MRLAASLGIALLALGGCTLVPHPLTDADRLAEADGDRAEMFGNQEPLTHPLTLHEAFARALRYNLDGRVKLIEEALAQDDLDLSRYDLLPAIAIEREKMAIAVSFQCLHNIRTERSVGSIA